MATGNQPARSPYGRAGFKPRHKQTRLLRPGRLRGTPLSLPTACAASPAQSSRWRVDVRSFCQGPLPTASVKAKKRPARQPFGGLTATVPKSKIESTDSKHAVYENSNRNKSADLLPLRLSTACAAPPAQSPPYGVDPRREPDLQLPNSNRQLETIRNGGNPFKIMQMTFSNRLKKHESLSTHHCNSNRSYCRLEINIPPIKQRTEALSNRSKSADLASLASGVRRGGIGVLRDQRESKDLSSVFWRLDAGSPPLKHWRAFGMPAVRRTRSRMKGGGGTNEKAPTEGPARCPPSKRLAGRSYFNAPRFWRDRFRTDRREPSS
jgi:hypothetical protein